MVSCHGRGNLVTCHDRIRDRIRPASSGAELSPICEQKILLLNNNSRQGNIFLTVGNLDQPQLWILSSLRPCNQALSQMQWRRVVLHSQLMMAGCTNDAPGNIAQSICSSGLRVVCGNVRNSS